MRELLRVIASLSGVDLPGLPAGLQDEGAPPPRLDIKNLKDRFRNDLEGFSIKTTEELTKRAKEQTHAALDALQNEVGGRIDQVAAEFRERLELPAQVEKLLQPSVEEAAARLERSISQRVERMFTEQQQLVQERLQGALSLVQARISTLEQTVQQIRGLKPVSVVQLPVEQSKATVDNTTKKYESGPQNGPDGGLDRVGELKPVLVAPSSAEQPDAVVNDTTKERETTVKNETDGGIDQAFSRIKWSFKDILETFKIQPAQSIGAEGQRKAIPTADIDTQSRVEQALEQLGRLGSKNPHPAGKTDGPKHTP